MRMDSSVLHVPASGPVWTMKQSGAQKPAKQLMTQVVAARGSKSRNQIANSIVAFLMEL